MANVLPEKTTFRKREVCVQQNDMFENREELSFTWLEHSFAATQTLLHVFCDT
jgi:hypothetical protein